MNHFLIENEYRYPEKYVNINQMDNHEKKLEKRIKKIEYEINNLKNKIEKCKLDIKEFTKIITLKIDTLEEMIKINNSK